MQEKTKLDHAIYWAKRGFHVFPVARGNKVPMIRNWPELATTDLEMIKIWWEAEPEANIGCAPNKSGHWVLDIDIKGNENGYETLLALECEFGELPETMEVATPSGGTHLWYQGQADSTVRALGAGLDTRGRGGYVLLPGSRTLEGDYRQTTPLGQDPCPAPAWIMARMAERGERKAPEVSLVDTLDLPHNIERAIRFLERAKPAIEGDGGNHLTYLTAGWVKDFGLSEPATLAAMLEYWNDRCEPPWDEDALAVVVANAYEYGRNEPGSKALQDPNEVYKDVTTEVITREKAVKFKPRWIPEQDARQPPTWLVEGLIPEYGQCLLYGAPGSYKSFVALDMALSVANGTPTFGMATKQGTVLYIAGEGALGIDKARRPAWMLAKGVTADIPFATLDTMPFAGNPGDIEQFIRDMHAQEIKPRLIIIDTLARMAAGMDENSAKEMGVLLMQATKIQRSFGATLLFVHHSGKDDSRGARGSSALNAGFDTVIAARGNTEAKTVALYVDKQKDAEPLAPIYLHGVNVMGSLVFNPGAPDEEHARQVSGDAITRQAVHEALSHLGATTLGTGQSTKTLAVEILRQGGHGQEDDGYDKRLKACERSLRRLKDTRLSGYRTDLAGTTMWYATETGT